MSRVGRRAVTLPSGVKVERQGGELHVQGPKGVLRSPIPAGISVEVGEREVRFARSDDRKPTRAAHGLARALLANTVTGVTIGFHRDLEVQGVGYRAESAGRTLKLALGFSHPVQVEIPEGLQVSVQDNRIRVQGVDRGLVGEFAAEVRRLRPPEPYKGKGVRYADEYVRRKVGKAGAA